jgi:tetratricopeptide (TPR) repeat protein
LGETTDEEAMLKKVSELSAEAPDVYQRLMMLAGEREEWKTVLSHAENFSAVNPLLAAPHEYAAKAHEALGNATSAITRYRALLQLNPANPAQTHYRLGKLLHDNGGGADAKKHVLLALEEAPRFRAALNLLLQMNPEPSRRGGVPNKDPKP